MRYKLRFFLDNAKPMCEQYYFASTVSAHVPALYENVYLSDDVINDMHDLGIETGIIYCVVQRVFNYGDNSEGDGCTSVEISLRKTSQ